MAAIAVMLPSSHSGLRRQAIPAGMALPIRASEKRGQTPGRKCLPEATSRNASSSVPSGLIRTTGRVAAAVSSCSGSLVGRHVTNTTAAALLPSMPSQPSSTRTAGPTRSCSVVDQSGSRATDGGSRPQFAERRKNPASIRAGMMVASSSKDCLGPGSRGSDRSSSSYGSNTGSASDACQDTGEEGSAQPPPGTSERRPALLEPPERQRNQQTLQCASGNQHNAKTPLQSEAPTQRSQVPAGVEEDFEPHNWLSDSSIAFASSRLAESGGGVLLTAKRPAFPKSVMFMDPAMAFWLAMQEDSRYLEEAKAEMKLSELELLLCPINDTHNAFTADAGCHWSLLVCWHGGSRQPKMTSDNCCALNSFRYYDSLGDMFAEKGTTQAEGLAKRLVGKPVGVETGRCAQQTNFYDCGVYVLLFCEIIATAFVDFRRHASTHGDVVSPFIWEERLASVTAEEADRCRTLYHELAREGSQH